MHIDERTVGDTMSATPPDASKVGWFAARQPGIVRFFEQRLLRPDGDAFGVALEAAWRIYRVFEYRDALDSRII